MKVQKGKLPSTGQVVWFVLDRDYKAIKPIQSYISYLASLNRSSKTLRTYAHNLKLYWEYLDKYSIDWKEITLEQLSGFINWLRRPEYNKNVIYLETKVAKRRESTINNIISAVCQFIDYHQRLNNINLDVNLTVEKPSAARKYKGLLHHINKSKPIEGRSLRIKEPKVFPGCLSKEQIKKIIDACNNRRDKLLVCLLYESGIRVGEALGLRHEDFISDGKCNRSYIPEYVLKQFDEHKHKLPTPVKTMVSVMRDTGVRYSTLATIPFNCLEIDSNNKWWLKVFRVKIPQESRLPITEQLAEEIQEQQKFLKKYFNQNKYLFTARTMGSSGKDFVPQHNKVMLIGSFFLYLNKLCRECNITDENGELYIITSHQFRHSFGTEAINNGVPQHIVQKLLGHESPVMTSRYAHIHDETLRKELEKFHQHRTIDITGQIVELELDRDYKDLEWFTKEISAIALPSGYCGRPKILGDCDIAGDVGCYICPHFRTNKTFLSIHKEQLERINKILDKAYKYNWLLPIKKNEPIQQNLILIISKLEENNHEYPE